MEAARRLGLREEWMQHPGTRKERFGLSLSKRREAVRLLGARELAGREMARLIREKRERARRPCGAEECGYWDISIPEYPSGGS